jgi:hypothetical protein
MSEQTEYSPAEAKPALRTAPLISGNLRPYRMHPIDGAQIPLGMENGMADLLHERTLADWERELEDEAGIGFNLLWLSHVAGEFRSPVTLERLGQFLDLCAHRGVQVLLTTDGTEDWHERLDVEKELAYVGKNIQLIAEHFGQHPAFYAWYIPHEIYMTWGEMNDYMRRLYPALVARCKQALPEKPVTLSPFFLLDRDKIFGDYRYAEPDEYCEFWADLIRLSGFDIIMLQDSGEHFSYVTNEQRRPFFEAMAEACRTGGARLWGNVEVAEYICPSLEEFERRYGRIHHSKVRDLPWRPVPIDRLSSKLDLAAEFSERIVAWGYYQFGRPHLNPASAQWYADYQRYLQNFRVAAK